MNFSQNLLHACVYVRVVKNCPFSIFFEELIGDNDTEMTGDNDTEMTKKFVV